MTSCETPARSIRISPIDGRVCSESLRGGNLLQSCKRVDQRAIVALAFAAIALDVLQHLPHSVNRIQQRGGDLGGQCQRAIAQTAEQVFSDVRQFFELVETQK